MLGLLTALALALAVTPTALWALGAYGPDYGLISGAGAQTALAWAAPFARASVAVGVLALIGAAGAGLRRYGAPAILALLISAATLAVMAARAE